MIVDTVKSKRGKDAVLIIPQYSDIRPASIFKHAANKLLLNYAFDRIDKAAENSIETVVITINYHGIPADGLIISKNKYGKRTFFSDNWPNRAHNWIPCVDDPADKATVEFIVTAPSHYQVISNGVQIEETNLPDNKKLTYWKEDVPLSTKVMVIGAADFAVNNIGEVNCVPVSSWVFPENKVDGFYDYAPAKEILSWYMNYIGPYAYKKLANVQSKTIFGGMENASAIFYFENSVTGKREEEALLAHEIVHQWFGNSATEKSFAHLWLSEGFATYLTHIYLESKYGTDSLNKRMQKEREEIIEFVNTSKRPVVDSTTDYMSLLNVNSYQKGGWVLHMLRRELGDSIFKKAVRKYYETYAGKNADTKDLQKIFESVSGKSLEQFFKQWLYTSVNPKLKISWKNITKEKKVAITVEQLQNKLFDIPLYLFLITGLRKNIDIKIQVSKKIETFYFPTNGPLLQLDVDYKTSLLAEISVSEIK
jgi:aminopeptidase N